MTTKEKNRKQDEATAKRLGCSVEFIQSLRSKDMDSKVAEFDEVFFTDEEGEEE